MIVYGGDGGVLTAEAASGIVGEFQGTEGCTKGIVDEDFPEGRLADAEDELDGLHRLERADDPGKDAENAGFIAGWDCSRGWNLREEATVAGATEVGGEDGHLAIEAVYGSIDEGFSEEKGGVVSEEAGWKIV